MNNLISFFIENSIYISLLVFAVVSVIIIQSDLGKDKLEENIQKGIKPEDN